MRIFVCDDDPVSLKLMKGALTSAGHSVEAFEDGADLFEAFQKEQVPVIVSDWLMPRMTGVELSRQIRAMPGLGYTHFIIVTTLAAAEHATEAFRAGIDDYISKPMDPTDINARVAAAERAMLRQQELELRRSLDVVQTALGPEHDSLINILGDIATIYRRQQAWARCRAFLRRQLAIAEHNSRDDMASRLRTELVELDALEEKRQLPAFALPAEPTAAVEEHR